MTFRPFIVEHPRTGLPITAPELSRETGIESETIRHRWRNGRRGMELIAPPSGLKARASIQPGSPQAAERRASRHRQWLETPAGRLTTHLFRDYRGVA